MTKPKPEKSVHYDPDREAHRAYVGAWRKGAIGAEFPIDWEKSRLLPTLRRGYADGREAKNAAYAAELKRLGIDPKAAAYWVLR